MNGIRLTKLLAIGTTANYAYDDVSRLTQLQNVKGAPVIARFRAKERGTMADVVRKAGRCLHSRAKYEDQERIKKPA